MIVALKTDVARYAVSVPDLGHTYDFETRTGNYFTVDYEVLEAEQHLDQDAGEEKIEF